MSKKTYCRGCTFLFLSEGKHPMCLLKARWVGAALRSRVDIGGLMNAEMRNAFNTCTGKKLFSLRSLAMKRFMLTGVGRSIPLRAYPLVEEQDNTNEYRERLREPIEETDDEEDGDDEEFTDDEEEIIRPEEEPDGGDSGDEEPDESGGEPGETKE